MSITQRGGSLGSEKSRQLRSKQAYTPPQLIEHGSIEKITGWIGGPWGEFFGGQGTNYNPWRDHGDFGS